jgi:hypothetical protein
MPGSSLAALRASMSVEGLTLIPGRINILSRGRFSLFKTGKGGYS